LLYAKILVVSPHPDDDIVTSAGVVCKAVQRGEPVKIVYVTNGDLVSQLASYLREGEAVTGESYLGCPEDGLIFLGYPDGYLNTIYSNYICSAMER